MKYDFSKDFIKNQLKSLGVPQNCPVVVHTSLRAVGNVEGRAEGFLQTLIDYVTADGGLLLIPTHTWHRCDSPDKLTLDILSNDVCIGTLPKIASTYQGVHRSTHPIYSLAVFGDSNAARDFISHDENVVSAPDPSGCMGQIAREKGYVLLIGVGQEKNTFLHIAEEYAGVKNRLTKQPYPATVRLSNGEIQSKPLRLINAQGLGDVSERFPKFELPFYMNGCIKYGFIGSAKTQLCDANSMLKIVSRIVKRNGNKELLSDDKPISSDLYL